MIQQDKYYSIEYLMNDKDKPVLFILSRRGSGRSAYVEFKRRLEYLTRGFLVCRYKERSTHKNMRVVVIDTNRLTSVTYYGVKSINFDRVTDSVTIIFYTGEIKEYLSTEYTDIDCKRQL